MAGRKRTGREPQEPVAGLLAVAGRLPRAGLMMAGTLLVGCAGAATIALVPTLWLAAALATAVGLCAGVFGSLGSALVRTAADPACPGRVTSVVMLTMVGPAPGCPLVGAAIGTWGAARCSSPAASSPAWAWPSPWPPTRCGTLNSRGGGQA